MNKVVGNWVVRLHQKKTKYLVDLIKPMLEGSETVLDLGCGSGEVSKALTELGYKVTSVDVVNKVKVDGVNVLIYDGKKIPFENKKFDTLLLITVLHHVGWYEELLMEAGRVGKKVIVVEDVYENWWDRINIWFWDSVLNLEFFGHPHNNKDNVGWKKCFEKLGFKILAEKTGRIREVVYEFKQKAYLLHRGLDATD